MVVSGLPGSGKSTLARALLHRVDAVLLQSDRVRKLLVDAPAYSAEESSRVFAAIHGALEYLLTAGIPVILDATMLTRAERRQPEEIAVRTGARLLLVRAEAAEGVIRQRLAARQSGTRDPHDLSDAGIEVYELMRARMEETPDGSFIIRTDRDDTAAIETLARMMRGPAPPGHLCVGGDEERSRDEDRAVNPRHPAERSEAP